AQIPVRTSASTAVCSPTQPSRQTLLALALPRAPAVVTRPTTLPRTQQLRGILLTTAQATRQAGRIITGRLWFSGTPTNGAACSPALSHPGGSRSRTARIAQAASPT